ncbi:MAG: acetyl-CoA carboxylase biotin carboxyl carrier protein [Desulfarculus sp.]|nr:MAG: acetyl-CoA carboxylase biotin carboxyl carrier protein [Desulfarculus sp.]
MKMLENSSFNELHLEMGGFRLFLSKKGCSSAARLPDQGAGVPVRSVMQGTNAGNAPQAPAAAAAPDSAENDPAIPEGQIPIKSPMLGVFYRASEPGARPFVEEGSLVDKGDTLCIIEVMKLYSTITAEVSGRIAKVCAQDGQMVEYGQTLFLIEPGVDADGAQLS